MSLLSSFFKSSKKTNLTPSVSPLLPRQIDPELYGNLSGLANRYINNQGTGFGEDFVNQASNPIASSMRRNFQNNTAPTLSSNYSSRGLGRSNLAANAQGLAQGNVESDIGNMMAQFYQLNEAQKKTDVGFGANLGQNIMTGDTNAQHAQAQASENLANATNKDAMYRQGVDQGKTNQFLQSGAQMMVPLGGAVANIGGNIPGGVGDFLKTLGTGAGQFGQAMNQSAGPQILGKDEEEAFLKAYRAAKAAQGRS